MPRETFKIQSKYVHARIVFHQGCATQGSPRVTEVYLKSKHKGILMTKDLTLTYMQEAAKVKAE